MKLVEDVRALLGASPELAAVLALEPFDNFAQLAGALLGGICHSPAIARTVGKVYADNPELQAMSCHDIDETARRNFEPGGPAATLLFARGVQAIMAHRVAHRLWCDGDTNLSLAVKAACGRAFATDIHPAAQIGAGFWLDHGLGFVVGETAIIGEDVSVWHNVTLGSTLNDKGKQRHPRIERGVVIGAGATILGGITVGAQANIAAGALVLGDVPERTLFTGTKAQARGPARIRFVDEKGDPA